MVTEQAAREAHKLLDVFEDCKFEELTERQIRDWANTAYKAHHPDYGGDAAKFIEADRAKHILYEWLQRKPKVSRPYIRVDCTNCDGKGYIYLRKGFGRMRIMCGRCKGSGDAQWDADVAET
jgi:hypothetical protein